MSDKYIINSFQTPNFYVDKLMALLTPAEFKALIFAARKILGWEDKIEQRKDAISLTQFQKGTGLSRQGTIEVLKTLCEASLLVKLEKTSVGQTYWIECNPKRVNWEYLKARQLVNSVDQELVNSVDQESPQLVNSVDQELVNSVDPQNTESKHTNINTMPVGNFEDDYSDLFPPEVVLGQCDESDSPNGKEGRKGVSPESVLAAAAQRNEAQAANPREHPVYKVFRDYDPEAAAEFLSLLSIVSNDYPDFQGDLKPLLCAFIAVTGAKPLVAGEGRLATQTKRQWKAELQYHLDNFRDDKPELSVPKIAYLYHQAMAAYRKSTKNDFPVVKSPNTLTAYMATEITRYEKRKA